MEPLRSFPHTVTNPLQLEEFLNAIQYRVAQNKDELEKAFTLVYKEYLKRGYVQESPTQLRVSIFNALPQTTTFIATLDNEVITTATIVPDSPLGLPMDEIYHEELNGLRTQKLKLCEITMLASNTELFGTGVFVLLNSKKLFFIFSLFKLIFDYAREVLKLDGICITVNPKHSLTYDFLLFKELGGLKSYHHANEAPAIGKYLDLRAAEQACKASNREGLFKMFLTKKSDPDKYSGKYCFSPADLKYFFINKSDVFRATAIDKIDFIKTCYPSFDFQAIL